jgi:mRNA interferase MazF|uniref:type II toxin-antitoxin system PemK/MazF family toxin n=1 Tax=Coprococcus catus TaxID=116085 RepID=UPI0021FB5C79|nr:type II toxin-antitoxin system PemK/MazF family toxin [Coprococcus catus]UWG22697.1 MAG: PemK-like, MazF-like toxin of type II toxin-antitoxin system [Bacteriophage sp.]
MYEHFTRQQQQFNVRRGDVYYINNNRGQRGNEIRKDRPAVVVSADFLNKHSGDVVVVFLTSQPKKDMSTHVTIRTTGRVSEALCEQPTTVSVERLNNRIGSVTDREMQQIDIALQIALKLDAGADTKGYVENQSGGASREQMIRLEAERDTYKKLYEDMICRR